jgi:polar amino acid transport system ATP-binding protein
MAWISTYRKAVYYRFSAPAVGGKTTLLRCVNLLETYDSGSIKVDGIEIGYREGGRRRSERELARIRAEKAWCFSSSTCSGT